MKQAFTPQLRFRKIAAVESTVTQGAVPLPGMIRALFTAIAAALCKAATLDAVAQVGRRARDAC